MVKLEVLIKVVIAGLLGIAVGLLCGVLLVQEPPIIEADPTMCPNFYDEIEALKSEVSYSEIDLLVCETKLVQIQKKNSEVNSSLGGQYNPRNGVITVYTANVPGFQTAKYTFLHEWGHWKWFNELGVAEMNAWNDKFEAETDFPTEYAKTSVEEYYAESFAEGAYFCGDS